MPAGFAIATSAASSNTTDTARPGSAAMRTSSARERSTVARATSSISIVAPASRVPTFAPLRGRRPSMRTASASSSRRAAATLSPGTAAATA